MKRLLKIVLVALTLGVTATSCSKSDFNPDEETKKEQQDETTDGNQTSGQNSQGAGS